MDVKVKKGDQWETIPMNKEATVRDLKKEMWRDYFLDKKDNKSLFERDSKFEKEVENIIIMKDRVILLDHKKLSYFHADLNFTLIMKLTLFIHSDNKIFSFELSTECTVKQLKEQLSPKIGNVPVGDIHLQHSATRLKDEDQLCIYNLKNNDVIVRIVRLKGGKNDVLLR